MNLSVFPLNSIATNEPNEWVDNFAHCIQGQINESTLGFLRSIAKENATGLQKLTSKLQQLQLDLKVESLHHVMSALTNQLKIPRHAMLAIHDFLQAENKQQLVAELQNLYLCHHQSRLLQTLLHIMDNLNIFTTATAEHQFLRMIICIMVQWNTDQTQRSSRDAAKWLKSVLGIPYKSELGQIISLIADHLHLGECMIQSDARAMDCLELFFLMENLTCDTEVTLVAETNEKLLVDIHAIMCIIAICKQSPHAFYDMVTVHENDPAYSILSTLKSYHPEPLQLDKFFLEATYFKDYFIQKEHHSHLNQHIFLSSFITQIHDIIYANHDDNRRIKHFLDQSLHQLKAMDKKSFNLWFETHRPLELLNSMFSAQLFDTAHQAALAQKQQNTGRIRAYALQLVSLGFSHRSASSLHTGTFQPLVNTDIADINVSNIQSLDAFCSAQTRHNQIQLYQELLLLSVIYQQQMATTQQSSLNPTATTTPIQHLQHINKANAHHALPRLVRNPPKKHNPLFAAKTKKKNPLQDLISFIK